jgi:hypothetical protein
LTCINLSRWPTRLSGLMFGRPVDKKVRRRRIYQRRRPYSPVFEITVRGSLDPEHANDLAIGHQLRIRAKSAGPVGAYRERFHVLVFPQNADHVFP